MRQLTSEFFHVSLVFFYTDPLVYFSTFDEECAVYSKGVGNVPLSDDSDINYSDHSSLWENDSSSSVSSVESSPHEVPKLEAYLYYFGLCGPRRRGPKLIFRTSKDVFTAPSGPEQEPRHMQLRPVYKHHILSKDDLWPIIRSQLSPYGTVVTTPITIWVGVLPDTLTGEDAFKSSIDILDLLREHGISDLDVAYRESVARGSSGPELLAPVSDLDPLKAVIDPVTTALSLPIAGLKTLYSQGTMGFYFKVGQDMYAVTARHVLFPENEGNNTYSYVDERNSDYTYKAGPKKEVVLMGSKAFHNFLVSIQGHIGIMNSTVDVLEKRVTPLTTRSKGDGPHAEQATRELEETQRELTKTRAAIEELKNFFVKMKKQWSKPKDRVIGHVVWAPPISVHTAPHSYMVDVCVVKLDKKKFLKNFRGNVLDLGPEIDPAKFISLMYPRIDAPSDFDYPAERLLKLRGILSAEEIRTPNNRDYKGDPMRYVIKRGHTTLTTIGCLNGFESHVRRYFTLGSRDSVAAAVYPYDSDSGPFSRGGDSGSIIVDALGKFVALLTGGTGPTHSSDITFGTPMHWLWDVIKNQFPGANLYIEDDNN
ncbi:hypothetical protein FISHEDRAFT_58901 [Fistulina hepatica ATCC 64428]|uniref:Uncharacterized protein n=1 Tax=Fistulina hepatica ATCC 64428 TaxID=1128425 RepID=A0A0D7ABM5_9AGAR|nr:hypothetical protein FISHEDRAFT_58901 [Fistulina hepatica ATCC 64428]